MWASKVWDLSIADPAAKAKQTGAILARNIFFSVQLRRVRPLTLAEKRREIQGGGYPNMTRHDDDRDDHRFLP